MTERGSDDAARAAVVAFADRHGRRPRLLVAGSPGQDADPGIAATLAGFGCDVDVAAPADAAGLAGQAIDDDVHAVVLTAADDASLEAVRNAVTGTGIRLVTAGSPVVTDPALGLVELLGRIPDDPT